MDKWKDGKEERRLMGDAWLIDFIFLMRKKKCKYENTFYKDGLIVDENEVWIVRLWSIYNIRVDLINAIDKC